MGYCMDLRECDFNIKNNNKVNTFKLAQEILLKNIIEKRNNKYAWIENSEIENAKSVEELLAVFKWDTKTNKKGDIVDLYFAGERLGDDKILFDAIASGVESDSFIELQGEDGNIWRWIFNDGKCEEKYGKIVFE